MIEKILKRKKQVENVEQNRIKDYEEFLAKKIKRCDKWDENLKEREANIMSKSERQNDAIINLKLDNLVDYNKHQDENNLSLRKDLHGNGKKGVLSRLDILEIKVYGIVKLQWIIVSLLIAGMGKIIFFSG